jgi:hypothetical protein
MAKGQQRSSRETKKPKKDKPKTSAAAPSIKRSASAAVESGGRPKH